MSDDADTTIRTQTTPLGDSTPRGVSEQTLQVTVPDTLQFTVSRIRPWTASIIAFGLLIIFGLTVVPPIIFGLSSKLDPAFIDLVKWMVAVEIAALGTVFGFYFSEERRPN